MGLGSTKNNYLSDDFNRFGIFDRATKFTSNQGHEIHYGVVHASEDASFKGTMVLTTGYGQSANNFGKTIKFFADQGYEVWAMDWHGHGLSGRDDPDHPDMPSTRGLSRHVSDLDQFVTDIVGPERKAGPFILSTFSMGGHVGGLYLKEHPDTFDAAILGAPMFDIYRMDLPLWARPAVRSLFNAASAIGLGSVGLPRLTSAVTVLSKAVMDVKALLNRNKPEEQKQEIEEGRDALRARLRNPTSDWIRETWATTDQLLDPDHWKDVKTRIKLLVATDDDLVDNSAIWRVASYIPNASVTEINSVHDIWPSAAEGKAVASNLAIRAITPFLEEIQRDYNQDKNNTLFSRAASVILRNENKDPRADLH